MKRQKITTKVCIIGDPKSGKSTFAECGPVVRNSYIYTQSLGLNIFYHGPFVVELEQIVNVNLILWELTLEQTNQSLRRSYMRGASVVFIVCDMGVTVPFSTVVADIEFARLCAPTADIYVVANKLDLNPTYDFSAMEKLAKKLNVILAKTTTSKNHGTEAVYLDAAKRIALQQSGGGKAAAQALHLTPNG